MSLKSKNNFNSFINKEQVNGLNIWFLGHIPNLKKPGVKYEKDENHWGQYYDYLISQIHNTIEKPNLIVLDKKSFYHFMQDSILNNLKIKTLVI